MTSTMFIPPPLTVSGQKLLIEGIPIAALAERFGTPIYAYSKKRMRENFQRIRNAFAKYYPKVSILYAVKANNNPAIARILVEEGAGMDVCNPAEIWLAKKLRVPQSRMLYTGNYCTDEELKSGVTQCDRINLDDDVMLPRLLSFGMPKILSFRINPGIGKGSVKSNVFAGPDAKFGIPIEHAEHAYRKAIKAGVRRFGMHMMTGSQILDPEYFHGITRILLDEACRITKKLGIRFEFIDIGGGFGVRYREEEHHLDLEKTASLVAQVFEEKKEILGTPTLIIEPGRYLVADSGVLIGTVQMIKKSYQTFVGTDVTINHLVRPKMYGAYHHIVVDRQAPLQNTFSRGTGVNVCGSLCDSGDLLAKDRFLSSVERGDRLIICHAGAYGFSMSSQYNSRPRAREILVSGKRATVIREKESIQDLFRHCQSWL